MSDAKQSKLDKIQQQIADDNVTPELKEQATQLVFGDGNVDSEIVFIGEAPGKNEDLQGKPFVGASGKFLDEMLEMIGMKREDIYITNIVKYRPPDNRDPKPEEKKAFLPYLQSQLEVIQPKVVVTLGRHSMNCFLPDLQISKVHGEPKRIKLSLKEDSSDMLQVVILPLFHPAAALYNPLQRQVLIDDFAKIPLVIEKLEN
jgi:uracil-DNA glycosylase family 4